MPDPIGFAVVETRHGSVAPALYESLTAAEEAAATERSATPYLGARFVVCELVPVDAEREEAPADG